ncbi:Os03g0841600, partial [Oryza sativa Japonica Group]
SLLIDRSHEDKDVCVVPVSWRRPPQPHGGDGQAPAPPRPRRRRRGDRPARQRRHLGRRDGAPRRGQPVHHVPPPAGAAQPGRRRAPGQARPRRAPPGQPRAPGVPPLAARRRRRPPARRVLRRRARRRGRARHPRLLLLPDKPTPRVYCIGPLVDAAAGKNGERHPCLAWLDAQPRQSVVFLCFGSKGAFPAAQLKDIARGLENSGHRFLWAVRSPPEEQSTSPEPDLERLLPAGFLERTKHRGMVVKNWAPQAEVVRHEAAGAFVTHCGWNSTLEAIMSALPMICWPLYAEQAMNRVLMVEEMKVAVALDGGEVGGALVAVAAEEVEAKVRLVMETEEGRKLRERVVETRDMALDAINGGGSSEIAFDEFMRDLEKMNSLENGGGRSC